MLTKDEIDELERLHKEATPGEWRVANDTYLCADLMADYCVCLQDDKPLTWYIRSRAEVESVESNFKMLVAVRNLLPRIIAALREKSDG